MVLILGAISRTWSVSGGEETEPQYAVCLIIGSLVQFFLLASILWTVCIAHTLFMVLTVRDYNPERFEKFYHIFCWSLPLLFDIILLLTKSIGDSGIWCWIKGDGHQIFRYFFLYLPLLIAAVTNIILYLFTYLQIRRERKNYTPRSINSSVILVETDSNMLIERSDPYKIQSMFGYFTAVLIICWTFPLLNGILHAADPDNINFGVYFMNALLLPLQGFLNAIVYGLNDEIRTQLRTIPFFAKVGNIFAKIKSLCFIPCKRNEETEETRRVQYKGKEQKKWYASVLSEYDEKPERDQSEGSAISEIVLSRGSLYTSAEFDDLIATYRAENNDDTIDI